MLYFFVNFSYFQSPACKEKQEELSCLFTVQSYCEIALVYPLVIINYLLRHQWDHFDSGVYLTLLLDALDIAIFAMKMAFHLF